MTTITITDISNHLFQVVNPITFDIEDYFTSNASNINISGNSDSDVVEILTIAFNKNNFKHLTLYLAYKLLYFHLNFETIISDTLLNLYDIDNESTTLIDYINLTHEFLSKEQNRIDEIAHGITQATPDEIDIYGNIKYITITTKLGDIYGDTLTQKMHDLSYNDNNQFMDIFLRDLNKSLNLDFSNLDFSGVNFQNVNLDGNNLTNCDFSGANLTDSSLKNCNLQGIDFTNTNLSHCDLRKSNLTNVDLSMTIIDGITTNEVVHNFTNQSGTRLPPNFIYDNKVESVIYDLSTFDYKGEAASSAANNGVSQSLITEINTLSNINSDYVDRGLQQKVKLILLNASSETHRKKLRHDIIRILLYKIFEEKRHVSIDKNSLFMPSYFKKPRVRIFGNDTIIDLRTELYLKSEYGFYSPINDYEKVYIIFKDFHLKICVLRVTTVNDVGRYIVFKTAGNDEINITNVISSTYIVKDYFQDGDLCTINELDLFFGGVGECEPRENNPYVFGDPYIFPIYGQPTKLPDCNNYYRLLQGKDIYINTYVGKLSDVKRTKMEEWFYQKTGMSAIKTGFVTSGYFMRQHWIYCEGYTFFCDFDKHIMELDESAKDFFTIRRETKYEKKGLLRGGKHTSFFVSWNSKHYGNIELELKIYENPQLDNGLGIKIEYGNRSLKGLMIRNYVPSIMKLPNLTKKKEPRITRRLKKRNKKFKVRKLIGKNEIVL